VAAAGLRLSDPELAQVEEAAVQDAQ